MTQAKTYSGRINHLNNQIYLEKSRIAYLLKTESAEDLMLLEKLQNEDYVSLEAEIVNQDSPSPLLVVSDINYIGLNDLIGYWESQTGECYAFTSFTKMSTYTPNTDIPCSSRSSRVPDKPNHTSYTYFINPKDLTWDLALSSEHKQFAAEIISLTKTSVHLNFYEAQTGQSVGDVILTKNVRSNSK